MREIINSDFDASQHQIAIVDFWADWCMPCRMLMPVFTKLASEITNVAFYKANVEENNDLVKKHGISGIPALVIFKDGQVQSKLVGMQSEAKIREALQKVMQG